MGMLMGNSMVLPINIDVSSDLEEVEAQKRGFRPSYHKPKHNLFYHVKNNFFAISWSFFLHYHPVACPQSNQRVLFMVVAAASTITLAG